jgi:signal peptidase I
MITLLVLIGVLAGAMLLTSAFLGLGLRLGKARRAGLHWALLTLCVVLLGWIVLVVSMNMLPIPEDWLYQSALSLACGVACLLWLWASSKFVLRATTTQVVIGWLAAVPACLLIWLGLTQVVRPLMLEVHYLRSNSMAPTLLALHHHGTCPHCGGQAVVPYTTTLEYERSNSRFGMCCDCKRMGRIADTGWEVYRSDRFIVNKLVEPQRWDLIMYRDPLRQVRFAKRLVGLPGEEVVIRDGAVFINGEKQELPPELAGLEFSQQQFDGTPICWGTPDKPAKLGADEYFVLDDFSVRGNDSRMWTQECEGRSPYALPRSHVEGVVGLICWPEHRFRCLR